MVQHIHRTAVFTIHNPTNRVKSILEHTFACYTAAYGNILHHFSHYSVEELHAMATFATNDNNEPLVNVKQLAKNLFTQPAPSITAALAPLESSLRESLKTHVAESLLSYVELARTTKQKPSYPQRLRAQDKEPQRLMALEALRTIGNDREEEHHLASLLGQTKQSSVVSIPFSRIEAGRNCGLFYSPETRRFYARLFIVSPKAHNARPITLAGQYIDVRTGNVYTRKEDVREGIESFGGSKGSIMVVLEMGRWHEQALRFTETAFLPQRNGGTAEPAIPVSAKLVKTERTYQLHVAFRLPKPERVKPQTFLGVDRGITCLAAGAVVSLDGKSVLDEFIVSGTQLRDLQRQMEHNTRIRQAKGKLTKGDKRRARIADEHVHLCANQIVEMAIKHQAQIIMEDLQGFATIKKRPKGQRRSNFNAMLPRRQYQKLEDIIDAKLALTGLPPIRKVSASFTSQTCSNCGHISNENRSKEDRTIFCCASCQHADHADMQAGINIARKVHWLTVRGDEKKRNIPDAERTSWAAFIKDFCMTLSSHKIAKR